MKILKAFAGVTGALALTMGAVMIAVAIGVTTWVGTGDTIELPQVAVETDDSFVIVEDIDLIGQTPDEFRFIDDFGAATITARSRTGEDVFIGVADTRSIAGLARTGDVDAAAWVASDYGPDATVDWDMESGAWSLVVAGPDLSPLDMTIDAVAPAAPFRAAAGIVGAIGSVFAVAGAALLWVALRRDGRPVHPPTPATAVA